MYIFSVFTFRVVVPILLLIAATLKFVKFLDYPYEGIFNSPIMELSSICIEYGISILILSQYKEKIVLLLTKLLFLIYCIYDIFGFIYNKPTCNCLGTTLPIIYMYGINVLIFCLLCFYIAKNAIIKLNDKYKILVYSLITIYSFGFIFFMALDNPERKLKVIRGHNLVAEQNIIRINEKTKEINIKLSNISKDKIAIIGFNSNEKISLGAKFPLTINGGENIIIPVWFSSNNKHFKGDINLLTNGYPQVIKIKIIGEAK